MDSKPKQENQEKEEKKRKKKGRKDKFFKDAPMCDKMHFDAKEAYKLLRTNVTFTLPEKKCRKIGITSANRGEGKSTVAINLAYTISATNDKVLLIDMDLRLPSISKKLSANYKYGIVDYLVGNANEDQIVYKTNFGNWDIIFSGSIPPTPAELIGSNKMKAFIEKLEKKYDYIIIDLPPVNVVSDASVAKDITDGFLLVVRENYSDKHSLSDCLRQLEFLDTNILGYVLVDSLGINSSYSKRYYKYGKYYKKYGYGYYKNYGYHHSSRHNNEGNGDILKND